QTIPSPVSEAIYFLSGWADLWLLGAGFGSVILVFLFSGNLHNLKSSCREKILV
ncbi:hypothetical protein N330_03002, partial [Leptosomus discolor]